MKCKFGSIVTDAAGKIGGHVFKRARSGNILTSNPIRNTNPTKLQSQQRSNFAKVSSAWKNLSKTQRNAWNYYASQIFQNNKLGDKYSLSGFTLFSKCNNNLLYIGENMITDYTIINNTDSILVFNFNFNTRIPEMLLNIEATLSENSVMVLEATRPVGVGTMSPPTNFEYLMTITDSEVINEDIYSIYQSKFGIIACNQTKIFMRLKVINTINGTSTTSLSAYGIQDLPYYRDYGLNWTDLGQQFNQTNIYALTYLGNGICLAGTAPDGKILRSTDYGETWTDLGQQFTETKILSIATGENGVCLAGTAPDGKILRSTDYGETWTDLGQQFSQTQINCITYAGDNVFYAGTSSNGYLLISQDNGLNWTNLGQQDSETDILCMCHTYNDTILVGTSPNSHIYYIYSNGDHVYETLNDDSHWKITAIQFIGHQICLAGTYDEGKVFRSTNGGDSWKTISTNVQATTITSISKSYNNIVILATDSGNPLKRSTDNGLTFESVRPDIEIEDLQSIVSLENGTFIAGSSENGKIYISKPAYY